MNKIWIIIMTLLFTSAARICGAGDDRYVEEYLKRLESSRTAVFFAECRLKSVKTGRVELVIPIGETVGLYIERTDRNVINTADVTFTDGKWALTESLGGVYTIQRANNLVSELLNSSFRLLLTENLGQITSSQPKRPCKEKLPG